MPYKTGSWGVQAKNRSKGRLEYFRNKNFLRNGKGNSVGFSGEEEVLNLLKGSRRFNRQIDLIWNGKLVDVKTAKPSKSKSGTEYWKFKLNLQKGFVDYFLLVCKGHDFKTNFYFLVPDGEIENKSIRIRLDDVSKYLIYSII